MMLYYQTNCKATGKQLANLLNKNIVLLCIQLLNKGRKSYWDNKEFDDHRMFCKEISTGNSRELAMKNIPVQKIFGGELE